MSCVELERCVRAGGFDTTTFDTATTEYEVDSIVLRMTPEQQDRLDAALALARVVVGPAAPRWQQLEAIAMEYLGEHPGEDGGNLVQIPVAPPVPQNPPVPEGTAPLPSSDLPTDPEELDRMVRAILEDRMVRDAEFGRYLFGVQRSKEYLELGFDSFQSYVRDRLGITPRTARLRIWLEKRMEELPSLREALTDGRLTLEKARLLAKGATAFSVSGTTPDGVVAISTNASKKPRRQHGNRSSTIPLRKRTGKTARSVCAEHEKALSPQRCVQEGIWVPRKRD